MSVGGAAARGKRTTILVAGLAVALVAVAAGVLILSQDQNRPTASATPMPPIASLDVTPAAALLPSVGATKQLAATAADGGPAPGTVSWTSSKPDVATVDGTGLVTARALGSAQVVAKAGELESAPVLITVVQPAAGTVLVEDAQVVTDPVETNPNAPVTTDSTYDVVLRGVTAEPGDLLLGTGEIPVGGRVVATAPSGSDTKVTLARATLPELLPNLRMEEVIDLSKAPIDIPPEVAANYDVVRDGPTLRFTPKPAFDQQVRAAAGAPTTLAGRLPSGGIATTAGPLFGIARGTYAVPPFGCEPEDEDEGPAVQPFKLTEAPSFDLSINPALDILWTDSAKRVMVDAAPQVTARIGVKSTVAFEAKWECKVELGRVRIRAGWLSLLITGLVPLGVGFELGGEVQVADFGVTSTTEARSTLTFGVDCPAGASCSVTGDGSAEIDPPVVEVDVQGLEDFRVKPSLELFGYLELMVGNPFLVRWQVEAAEAKVGAKLESDWAPRLVQILDEDYASEYGLSIELEAKAGPDLGSVAESLGLDDILAVGFEHSIDVLGSPTGQLFTDKEFYSSGEQGTATIDLEDDGLRIGSVYVIDKVLLVSYVDDEQVVVAEMDAADGQREFEIPFTAPFPLSVDDLYAFVVPRIPGLDLLALELGAPEGGSRIVFFRMDQTTGVTTLHAVDPDGTNEREVVLGIGQDRLMPVVSVTTPNDGSMLVLQTTGGLYITEADGSNARQVPYSDGVGVPGAAGSMPAFAPDGSSLLVIARGGPADSPLSIARISPEGALLDIVIEGQGYVGYPTWSPDGTQILFQRARNHGLPGIGWAEYGWEVWTAASDGTGSRVLSPTVGRAESHVGAVWSPDGSRILFLRLRLLSATTLAADIWTMNPDGTAPTQLTSGPDDYTASWSPDGTQIVFERGAPPNGELWIMDADGGNLTKLPVAPGARAPAWLP